MIAFASRRHCSGRDEYGSSFPIPPASLLLALLMLPGAAATAGAQQDTTTKPVELEPITVTATRTRQRVFNTASPVFVIDSTRIRSEAPNTAADVFRMLPGLDITGVGANQTRPVIRGQRGQRIILLQDGLRLNNARRQQDFGELPALADVNGIDRVEVVRGPTSVLYGTDAIGGAVNLISAGYPSRGHAGIRGRMSFLMSDRDDQFRPNGMVTGRSGRVGFRLAATYRNAGIYRSPAGSFGNITLPSETDVFDTGVQDESYVGSLGVGLDDRHEVTGKVSYYRARDAGFGRVDNKLLGPEAPFIQILYPDQEVSRFTLGYNGNQLGSGVADRVRARAYYGRNQRDLDINVFIPFGPSTPPGAGVVSKQQNFTDVKTAGGRLEAMKIVGGRHLLTYGVDYFQDHSDNTDHSVTTVVGFGPPAPMEDSTPSVPNATYRSGGIFVQGEFHLGSRLTAILGARGQEVRARTRETAGISGSLTESVDRALVGAANMLYALTDELHLVGSVGRGFRAPNIVELFFNGATPEGAGFQVSNPDLKAETSVNVDLGARFRSGGLYLEGFVYQNTIHDGIRIEATGDTVGGLATFRNVNVDRLRFRGVELVAQLNLGNGIWLGTNYAHQDSKDVNDPTNPVGDSYSDKIVGEVGYRQPAGHFSVSYRIRHNGEQRDNVVGTSPVGPVLPAFTVHEAAASVRLPDLGGTRSTLGVTVRNLSNALYAEFPNAGFFRPEPGRNVIVTWSTAF